MRAWLTTGLEGLRQPALRAAGALLLAVVLGCSALGCGVQAGGQSGGETCAPEIAIQDTKVADFDEDGGVEGDGGELPDGDTAFIANNPEAAGDAPRQCVVPED